mgnify:CR=1 FL=1
MRKRRRWGRWHIKGGILFHEERLVSLDLLGLIPPGPADAGKLVEDALEILREKGAFQKDAENLIRRYAAEITTWELKTGRQYPARDRGKPRFTKTIFSRGEKHGPETTGGDKEKNAL